MKRGEIEKHYIHQMKQPTREEITQKLDGVLDGSLTREAICLWAIDYIRNDE